MACPVYVSQHLSPATESLFNEFMYKAAMETRMEAMHGLLSPRLLLLPPND